MSLAYLAKNAVWARFAAPLLYVGIVLGVMIGANAGTGGMLLVWSVGSVGFGWFCRTLWWALLPFLAVVIAVPFGYPDHWSGGDPLVLWIEALVAAPVQAAFVAAGFWGRGRFDRARAARV